MKRAACVGLILGIAALAQGQIPGDANLDGYVDIRDLVLISTNYEMEPATRADGDVTGDGRVDGLDYDAMMLWYGAGTPAPPAPQPWQIWPEHDAGAAIDSLPGYKGYTVYLVSDDPMNPASAWEGPFHGPMHQCWDPLGMFPETPLLPPPIVVPPEPPGYEVWEDSHFMFYEEDLCPPNVWESEDSLWGCLGLWPDCRQQVVPFAYLVIADGQQVVMSGWATDPYGQGLFPTELVIPEPAALGLVALGAVTLLRRRRRA